MSDETYRRRLPSDSPGITFCALHNTSYWGWRNVSFSTLDTMMKKRATWINVSCNTTTTVNELMSCIEEKTFNRNETIVKDSEEVSGFSRWSFNETAYHKWSEVIQSFQLGKIQQTS